MRQKSMIIIGIIVAIIAIIAGFGYTAFFNSNQGNLEVNGLVVGTNNNQSNTSYYIGCNITSNRDYQYLTADITLYDEQNKLIQSGQAWQQNDITKDNTYELLSETSATNNTTKPTHAEVAFKNPENQIVYSVNVTVN